MFALWYILPALFAVFSNECGLQAATFMPLSLESVLQVSQIDLWQYGTQMLVSRWHYW